MENLNITNAVNVTEPILKLKIDRNFTSILRYFLSCNNSEVTLEITKKNYCKTYLPLKAKFALSNTEEINQFLKYFHNIYEDTEGKIYININNNKTSIIIDYTCNYKNEYIIKIKLSDFNFILKSIIKKITSNDDNVFNITFPSCDIFYYLKNDGNKPYVIHSFHFSKHIISSQPFELFEKYIEGNNYTDEQNIKIYELCKKCNMFLNLKSFSKIELAFSTYKHSHDTRIEIEFLDN